VYERALARSVEYDIEGVTYMLTMGVVKNIIPAVASTNAIVAAACVNEVVKILTFCSQSIHTYMMYFGREGVHSHTFVSEKKDDCPVCCIQRRKMTVSPNLTLNQLLQMLKDGDLRMKSPSLTTAETSLYMQNPPALEKMLRPNLDKALSLLIEDCEELTITDPVFGDLSVGITIKFESDD